MDYGGENLLKTIKLLDDAGIKHVGAGENIEEALKPLKIILNGQKIVIHNFGWNAEETIYATKNLPGSAPRENSVVYDQIKRSLIEDKGAFIITVFHWGFEYNLLPQPYDIKLAHGLVDLGCKLIIGHHPHNIQPYEIYNNVPIFYSLGNFYFSSLRKILFEDIKFNNQEIINQCDYGIGVIIELENSKLVSINIINIFYDSNNNMSKLLQENNGILKELPRMDYFNSGYLALAKMMANNKNPILTANEKISHTMIKKIVFRNKVASYMQDYTNNKIGKLVYKSLKWLYNKNL